MDKISKKVLYKCLNDLSLLYFVVFTLFTFGLIIKNPITLLLGFIGITCTFITTFFKFVFSYDKISEEILTNEFKEIATRNKVFALNEIRILNLKTSDKSKEIKLILSEFLNYYNLLLDKYEKNQNPVLKDLLSSFESCFSHICKLSHSWNSLTNLKEKLKIFKEIIKNKESVSALLKDFLEESVANKESELNNDLLEELKENLIVAKRVEDRISGIGEQKNYSEKDFE